MSLDKEVAAGEIAGVFVKDAGGISRRVQNVAVLVEHGEGVAMFERARPGFLKRRCRRDVEGRGLVSVGSSGLQNFVHEANLPSP